MSKSEETDALDKQLIEKIYTSDGQFVLAITGGGTSIVSHLFSVPGASGTVLEACVPYHQSSLAIYLRSRTPANCSSATARAMAMVAYERACMYGSDQPLVGIGCTAAIATNRTRRGADRCHIAVQSEQSTMTFDLALEKSLSRAQQEKLCADLVLYAIASGLHHKMPEPHEQVVTQKLLAPEPWRDLLNGVIHHTGTTDYQVVFPGAFNPLHDGHRRMIEIARQRIPGKFALELSIENVDKPPLDYLTLGERRNDEYEIVFTRAPTFQQKSVIFPGATFVVGLDTIVRIDDPKYYDGSLDKRNQAIADIRNNGNRFLVFGRLGDQHFMTLEDVSLSDSLQQICDGVTADEFRMDISSTKLREENRT